MLSMPTRFARGMFSAALLFVVVEATTAVLIGQTNGLVNARMKPNVAGNIWAQKTLAELSLEEKVGQMLQVRYFADYGSFDTPGYLRLRDQLQQYHIGSVALGVHIGGVNLLKSTPLQAAKIANRIQADSKIPVLIAADLERGLAYRLDGVPEFPFEMAYGALNNREDARELGRATAQEARAIGIQWAFAPVVDVNTNPANPIVNTRSFGDDSAAVASLSTAFIQGAHTRGLLVTAKHFPGQGDLESDSHLAVPTFRQSLDHLQSIEFPPFKAAINAGVDAVLIEHARVPALDPDPGHVATNSNKIINGVLRGELGFDGLVVTDALEMRGLLNLYASASQNPTALAAVDAVKAGNDVITVPKDIDAAFHAIVDAVRNGDIAQKQIDQSVLKILEAKAALGLNQDRLVDLNFVEHIVNSAEDLLFAQSSADRSITLVKDSGKVLPLKLQEKSGVGPRVVFVVFKNNVLTNAAQVFQSALRSRLPEAEIYFLDPKVALEVEPRVLDSTRRADKVVVAAFVSTKGIREELVDGKIVESFGLIGPSGKVMREILDSASDKTAVVAIGSPYVIENFPSIQTYLCTFSTSTSSELSAIKAIFGEIDPQGRLPVILPGIADRGVSLRWSKTSHSASN